VPVNAPPATGSAIKPTAKGRATRQAFLDAARRVVARNGYLNARLSDIADEAGKSMASFYNYFDSKEALLAELATDFDAELQALVAEPFRQGLPAIEALHEAIRLFYRQYQRRMPEIVGIVQASMIDENFAKEWRQIRTNGVHTLARFVRNAQRDGWAPGLHPELAASALSSMLEHFCWVWIAHDGDAIDVDLSEDEAVDTLWTLMSHAVYWRPDPE
jgi:AcrR family transcriptional regulator